VFPFPIRNKPTKHLLKPILEVGGKFEKAECYSVVQGSRPFDLAGERNEKTHAEQRKLVARAYTMDSMIYLEPKVDVVIKKLIEKLNEQCGNTIDLGTWLQYWAFGT
jgi:hypothetical protein